MKPLGIAILAVLLTGCAASTTASTNRRITEVVAMVRGYDELVPLGTKQPEPSYYSIELEIVSPAELRGAMIEAKSETALKENSLLRKVGSTLSLAISHLEQNRGAYSLGDAWHVVYHIKASDIKNFTAKKENSFRFEMQPVTGAKEAK